jgi:Tfp pilus assembly protein PilF
VDKDPRNPIYHYHLGLAQALAGDKTSAKRSLARALSIDPSFSGAEDARKRLESL